MSTENTREFTVGMTTHCNEKCSEKMYLCEVKNTLEHIFNKNFYLIDKYKIDKEKLIQNLIDKSLAKEICQTLNPVAGTFSILNTSLKYYRTHNNEVMINFIDLALMEANLMYFEDTFYLKRELFNKKDELFIEHIIDNNF